MDGHMNGHNNPPADRHLHSHPHSHPHAPAPDKERDEDTLLADALMEGFDAAEDKASFLRMARVPLHLHGEDGETLNLVDVEMRQAYQVATASPGFGTGALVHLPFPASMIRERADMVFVYVSLKGRRDVRLREMVQMLKTAEEQSQG